MGTHKLTVISTLELHASLGFGILEIWPHGCLTLLL
jgi:hypothetical protein